jgi:RecB family endonuclease NucS
MEFKREEASLAMTPLVDSLISHFGAASHKQLVEAAAKFLRARNWDVETEPRVGHMRPDIVARDTRGNPFVIEIKSRSPGALLGAVAQVEAQVEGYRQECGAEARGILVLAGDVPAELSAVAQGAGVELVRMPSGRPAAIAESLSALTAGTTVPPAHDAV